MLFYLLCLAETELLPHSTWCIHNQDRDAQVSKPVCAPPDSHTWCVPVLQGAAHGLTPKPCSRLCCARSSLQTCLLPFSAWSLWLLVPPQAWWRWGQGQPCPRREGKWDRCWWGQQQGGLPSPKEPPGIATHQVKQALAWQASSFLPGNSGTGLLERAFLICCCSLCYHHYCRACS